SRIRSRPTFRFCGWSRAGCSDLVVWRWQPDFQRYYEFPTFPAEPGAPSPNKDSIKSRILSFPSQPECQSDHGIQRVRGRPVNATHDGSLGADSRLEVVLGLVIVA